MVHLRVLTATGIEELDKEIANKLALREIEVAGECYYREGLLGLAKERGADVVVLSPQLPGDGEILEVVKRLRMNGLRVVLLPGRRENETALKLARRSVALGVYDLVWDPVSPAVVVHRVERPATLAEAGVEPDEDETDNLPINGNKKEKTDEPHEPDKKAEHNVVSMETPAIPRERPQLLKKFKLPGIKIPINKKGAGTAVRYIPHHIIAVWSPVGGIFKSLTALNLSVTAAEKGFDAALLNFDLVSPVLDKWFNIPNTSIENARAASGAGIMTFGPDVKPELADKMLRRYKWGIRYLPAGNKLGNIGTPEIPLETLEEFIRKIYHRQVNGKPAVTVIDTCSCFELPPACAALKNASILLVPYASKQEQEVIYDQIAELARLEIKPKVVEVIWGDSSIRGSNEQVIIPYTPGDLHAASKSKKPYCFTAKANPFKNLMEHIF